MIGGPGIRNDRLPNTSKQIIVHHQFVHLQSRLTSLCSANVNSMLGQFMVCSMFAVDSSIKLLKIGRRMMWVLGGVCRFDCFYCCMLLTVIIIRETGEIFLSVCPKNKRDRPTLEKLILQHVHLGIHTLHYILHFHRWSCRVSHNHGWVEGLSPPTQAGLWACLGKPF